MNKNKIILILSSIVIISFGIYYIFKKSNVPKDLPFKTITPIKKNITQYVDASGTLKPKDEIKVGSLEAGRVIKIYADDNDLVKKGQVLLELDNGIGDSEIKRLKATLKEVTANLVYQEKFYERQKKLYQSEQISKDAFEKFTSNIDALKAKFEQTESAIELATKTYNNLFIKSPDDGVVIAKEVELGQMVTSRLQATVLYTIAKNLKEMEAHLNVDEADIGLIKKGQNATFTVDAFPKLKFNAKVKQIRYLAKVVDGVVTYATILDVDNSDLKLRPGMTTNVDIRVAQASNTLSVANKTLRINAKHLEDVAKKLDYEIKKITNAQNNEIDHVWLFENDKFQQVQIKQGAREGRFTQILGNSINENSKLVAEVKEIKKENPLLKGIFGKPGGIGSK